MSRTILEQFDSWVECTGFVTRDTSYYFEIKWFLEKQQEKIEKLEQALAVLREANEHYANRMDDGGTAREAELKVKEILG